MIKIFFKKHHGELDIETNEVLFYGLYFDNITIAIKFLDGLIPDTSYEPCYLRGLRCIKRPSDGCLFNKGQWWDSEEILLKMSE